MLSNSAIRVPNLAKQFENVREGDNQKDLDVWKVYKMRSIWYLYNLFFSSWLGVNLRTGRQGIFPSAYAVDMEYSDFDPTAPKVKRERYLLGYLGSVETLAHKGTGVVCQAVRRILRNSSQDPPISQSCILEVSDQGLRMVDRSKPRVSHYTSYLF